ncbi:MAG: DUF3570 domain-containing protein [Chthoniobacterales bacterium]
MINISSFSALPFQIRVWALVGMVYLFVISSAIAENFFDTRYQYYQEDHNRIRVDSEYSLFSLDINDTLVLDGSLLYSAISGASPTGLPAWTKGGNVPVVEMHDKRYAFTLGLAKQWQNHTIAAGFSYSNESDYISYGYSLQDTISLNQKNTDLVLGFAISDDTVGANGSALSAAKRSYDAIIGINQILTPNDLLSVNLTLGWKQGYLSDPYKRTLFSGFFDYYGTIYPYDYVKGDVRPDRKFEQLLFAQWTHYISWADASMETSYRFGHNDSDIFSHTARIAFYKSFFDGRVTIGPSFRYYRQTAASFYDTQFKGNPKYYSSDYRLSAEQTFTYGLQVRAYPIKALKDRLALDLGYERYLIEGLDHKTSQSAYPDANSITVGMHWGF